MKIRTQSWIRGLAIGSLIAVLIAILPTFLDWNQNPGGIFRGDAGTNWSVVFETLFSWLWPVILATVPISIVIHAWIAERRTSNVT